MKRVTKEKQTIDVSELDYLKHSIGVIYNNHKYCLGFSGQEVHVIRFLKQGPVLNPVRSFAPLPTLATTLIEQGAELVQFNSPKELFAWLAE